MPGHMPRTRLQHETARIGRDAAEEKATLETERARLETEKARLEVEKLRAEREARLQKESGGGAKGAASPDVPPPSAPWRKKAEPGKPRPMTAAEAMRRYPDRSKEDALFTARVAADPTQTRLC